MSDESIELDFDGTAISISLAGDVDFTSLAKHLTHLIEREFSISITWDEGVEPTEKAIVAKQVVEEIIESFNQVIEEQFEGDAEEEAEEDYDEDDIPF